MRLVLRPAVLTGFAIVVAAAVVFTLHAPNAFRGLDSAVNAEAGRDQLDGALATADMVGIDDDFIRAGLQYIPMRAQFAALVPDPNQAATTYHISSTTILAAPNLMQEVLLPRREIQTTPAKGDYVVCYLCDTSPWDKRTHWLWRGTKGDLVGLVYR